MRLPLTLLLAALPRVLGLKVIELPFEKHHSNGTHIDLLSKRQTLSAPLANSEILYFVQVGIGTPGQSMKLVLDTGSSDVWMSWSQSSVCLRHGCPTGSFNPKDSRTFDLISANGFEIRYVDGSKSEGAYFKDTFQIQGKTIQGQIMGLAEETTIGIGIMGVSFARDEAICSESYNCNPYPSVMEQMVSQGLIGAQAYSLWLDNLSSSQGSILFGGVDSSKYTGDLIVLPIQVDSQSHEISSFTVALTDFSITTSSGPRHITFDSALPAILDSGTSLTYLPTYLAEQILQLVGAQFVRELGTYVVPCADRDISKTANPTFNYQFGGSSGPTIKVAWSQLIEDIILSDGSRPTNEQNQPICTFGIMPATGEEPVLLGDTFLRSAYVVYDLQNQQIAMAQTNTNPGNSNIQEIGSSIPGASRTASGVQVPQTATNDHGAPGIFASQTPASGAGAGSTPIHFGASPTPFSNNGGSSGSGDSGSGSHSAAQTSTGAAAVLLVPCFQMTPGGALGVVVSVAAAAAGAALVLFS